MKKLPGNVFVMGQLVPAQLQTLVEQSVMSFINNRSDMEAPLQPLSEEMEQASKAVSRDYFYIPMSGGLTPGLIEASMTAYESAPSPIVTFCASGMHSGLSHIPIGIDAVMQAISDAGYQLEQLRNPLMAFAARDRTC